MKAWRQSGNQALQRGAALIIVLAFVVLLTGLAVAFLSRNSDNRRVADISFNDTDASILARGALDIVVADFRREIVNGSRNIGPGGQPFYSPSPSPGVNVVPKRGGNPTFNASTGIETPTDPLPNLIRRSYFPNSSEPGITPFPEISPPAVPSRASMINSTIDVSANGRSVSLARWNKHYLLPRHDPTSAGENTTPLSPLVPPYGPQDSTGFTPPDWVLVTRAGPVAFNAWQASLKDSTSNDYVVGRYAYAVYDEGGLLDINVAGFPKPTTDPATWTTDIGRKGVSAFADLTALRGTSANPPNYLNFGAMNKFVLFRNYATTGSNTTLVPPTSFSSDAGTSFSSYYLGPIGQGNVTGGYAGSSQDFGTVRAFSTGSGNTLRTDHNFATRGELIAFARAVNVDIINALQYLGTFSREKNIATWRAGGTTTSNIEDYLNAGRYFLGNLDLLVPGANGNDIGNTGLKWSHAHSSDNWSTGPAPFVGNPPPLGGPNANFMGLLNYGINAANGNADSSHMPLALGRLAALIDQYDPNTAAYTVNGSTTTVIEYGPPGNPIGTVYGMEDSDPQKPTWAPLLPGYAALNRPFRSGAELGYGYATGSIVPTNDFYTLLSSDAPLLDLVTYNNALTRSGTVNLNTRQFPVLSAILKGGLLTYQGTATVGTPYTTTNIADPENAAKTIVNATSYQASPQPATSKADIVRLANLVSSDPFPSGAPKEVREAIPRALVESVQTRTWGLLIDVIAQSGHYLSNASNLPEFTVQGEKHYWLHIAIDRFDGSIVGQQLEEVTE